MRIRFVVAMILAILTDEIQNLLMLVHLNLLLTIICQIDISQKAIITIAHSSDFLLSREGNFGFVRIAKTPEILLSPTVNMP